MAKPTGNPFFADKDRRRLLDRRRRVEHGFIVAALTVAIVAIAMTGSFSQIV